MKKKVPFAILVTMAVFLFLSVESFAGVSLLDNFDAKNIFLFGTGFFAGAVGHELGHEIAARAEGMKLDWYFSRGEWTGRGSSSQMRSVAAAGFGAQILGSEIVLNSKNIPKDSSFVLGYMLWNMLNPIFYTLRNEVFDSHSHSDLAVLDRNGWDARTVESFIIPYAVLSAYRMWRALDGRPIDTKIYFLSTESFSAYPFANFYRFDQDESRFVLGVTWRW